MNRFEIIPIDTLVPLETVLPNHLKNLEKMINNDGVITKPVIADRKTGIILDGSHRYVFFLKNGYTQIPVCFVDYESDDIRVGTKLSHRFFIDGDSWISKAECKKRALSGNLFSPRTTRHFFTFRKADISLPLDQLKKGDPVDVGWLIADTDVFDEIEHNKKYIQEINDEVEIVIQYLEEVTQTKKYLLNQIKRMDMSREIAFFPGKFHPPHIGHMQTILNLLPKYRKIIIGVSEDLPSDKIVTDPITIILALKSFFATFETIEVCKIDGVLSNKKDATGLPVFDVLLSGNEKVIAWAKDVGVKAEYVPRSEGALFSGTEIRTVVGDSDA